MCLSFSLLLYILLELSRDNILTHFEKQINYYYWETTILRIFFRYIIDKKLSSDLVALRFHFISKIFLIVYQTSIKFFFHDATNFFARSFFCLLSDWLTSIKRNMHLALSKLLIYPCAHFWKHDTQQNYSFQISLFFNIYIDNRCSPSNIISDNFLWQIL